MSNEYIEQLKEIFNNNTDKRILVIGTTCTGKSTLIKNLGIGLDMDKVIFPLLTKEESDYVCQTPWTNDELLKKRTTLRNVDFTNAKNMQTEIEEEIKNSNIKVIALEVIE